MATIGTMSTYLENKLINHFLRNTSYTSPTSVWLALYTVPPTETFSGTEVVAGGYARQNISGSLTVSGNTATNIAKIEFPEATEGWGTVSGIAITDAASGGNILFYATMDNSITVSIGENFSINSGILILRIKGGAKGGWGNEIPAQILNHVLKNTSFSTPGTSVYIATGSALSYDENYTFISWGETVGTGYSRKQVTSWFEPTNGSTYNLSDVIFSAPPIAADWGRITNIVIYNAPTSGSALLWGKLRNPIYITQNDGLKFSAEDISVVIN